MTSEMLKDVLLSLESMGSIKFGEFTLKSGLKSPVYFDLRLMVSDPRLMSNIAKLLMQVNSNCFAHLTLVNEKMFVNLNCSLLKSSIVQEKF